MTCGSVWECPVCSAAIKAQRARELQLAVATYGADRCYMATLTVRHSFGMPARSLRQGVALAFRKLVAGAEWKRGKARWAIAHFVRALEVTYGPNGWHPHLHVLFFGESLGEAGANELREWLARRWKRIVERELGDSASPTLENGIVLTRARDAGYLSKLGLEVAGGVDKSTGKGHHTVFQLAELGAVGGDAAALRAFKEYCTAFRGARMLTWSGGARAALGLGEPEYQFPEDAPQAREVLAVLTRDFWVRVRSNPARLCSILAAAEDSRPNDYESTLSRLSLSWLERPTSAPHSLSRDSSSASIFRTC